MADTIHIDLDYVRTLKGEVDDTVRPAARRRRRRRRTRSTATTRSTRSCTTSWASGTSGAARWPTRSTPSPARCKAIDESFTETDDKLTEPGQRQRLTMDASPCRGSARRWPPSCPRDRPRRRRCADGLADLPASAPTPTPAIRRRERLDAADGASVEVDRDRRRDRQDVASAGGIDLAVDDPTVSRRHVFVWRSNGGHAVP